MTGKWGDLGEGEEIEGQEEEVGREETEGGDLGEGEGQKGWLKEKDREKRWGGRAQRA